jgi:hypothetical protein
MAAAPPGVDLDHGGGAGDAIVGRRIKVFWPKDWAWYEGTIQAYKDSKHRGESQHMYRPCRHAAQGMA